MPVYFVSSLSHKSQKYSVFFNPHYITQPAPQGVFMTSPHSIRPPATSTCVCYNAFHGTAVVIYLC